MSSFAVCAHTLTVAPHPDADRLDVVRPDGTMYVAVALKGRFQTGDTAIYVPEEAVLPEAVLRATGFWNDAEGKGALAGPAGDRVKPVKLRGVLSQGILIHPDDAAGLLNGVPVTADGDWAPALGIAKFVQPIPPELEGAVYRQPGLRGYTDIENYKKHPDVLAAGEPVHITEKLHGICTVFAWLHDEGGWALHVSSKGLSDKGLALEADDENAYWRVARQLDAQQRVPELADRLGATRELTVFGETLGVQDLKYGLAGGQLAFRAFDLRVDGRFIDADAATDLLAAAGIPTVPALYTGPYSAEKAWELAAGKTEAMAGQQGKHHIREGVVVRPAAERDTMTLGRVILKFVSDAYLTRSGATTELQ